MQKIRIQKYLSQIGYCSRREAERLIIRNQIKINGQPATLGDKITEKDELKINGQSIEQKKQKKIMIAYHKPVGVECTLSQIPNQKNLADIDFGTRVFPIGRLDKDSRGLLLLTNDGELCNLLAHPRYQHEKEYVVRVEKPVKSETLKKLESGVSLNGKKTAPCQIFKLNDKTFRIILKQGRNRQIRRMCENIGARVMDLFRIRVGKLKLGQLPEGKWRVISETEIQSLN